MHPPCECTCCHQVPFHILNAIEATDSQIEEATGNGQKRAPPLSTQTTPVKSLSAPKRTRQAGTYVYINMYIYIYTLYIYIQYKYTYNIYTI